MKDGAIGGWQPFEDFDYNDSASITPQRGEWWNKASERLELDNSLFEVIRIERGTVNAVAKQFLEMLLK